MTRPRKIETEDHVKTLVKEWFEARKGWSYAPVQNGLGVHGIHDRVGCIPVVVTPEMVGKRIGLYVSVESKRPGRRGELRRGMTVHQQDNLTDTPAPRADCRSAATGRKTCSYWTKSCAGYGGRTDGHRTFVRSVRGARYSRGSCVHGPHWPGTDGPHCELRPGVRAVFGPVVPRGWNILQGCGRASVFSGHARSHDAQHRRLLSWSHHTTGQAWLTSPTSPTTAPS